MPENIRLRDGSDEQVDKESIYYSEEELAKLKKKNHKVLSGEGDPTSERKPKTLGDSLKWLGTRIANFVIGGILGAAGMFLLLKGFAATTTAFLEVNFPTSFIIMVCVGMGICTAFLATVGESYRLKRENDYSVNARDIQKRQDSSDSGIWKMMSEEEKKRNARMEQRRKEAEAEAEELMAQKAEAPNED